ncbi:MAG: D-alanyl-D-alanine carboxypeptidase/D-alanyl-D-alanine-endopeptidase [Bacteroidales bacterium]
MRQIKAFLVVITILILPAGLTSQNNNIQRYILNLKKDTLFVDAAVSILVTDSKGKTIASWNPDMPLLTASTMKTITTGTALNLLGKEFRFTTRLGYTGEVKNGVLYGDLVIVGGGDPTLGSADTLGIPVDSLFLSWRDAILNAGIRQINGHIVADDRFFDSEIVPESWSWSNLGPSYGSGVSGLSFNENLQNIVFKPGINKGDKVFIKSTFPAVPGMVFDNDLTTGEVKSGNRVAYYASDLAKTGLLKGTVAAGQDSAAVLLSNKFPHLGCAWEFKTFLYKNGILSSPGVVDAKECNYPSPEEIKVIHITESAPLEEIVNVTNRISNNFYAETLLKTIGKSVTGVGSYDSARVALVKELEKLGVKRKGFTQSDGSGLSRQNYVSARFFCNYFKAMESSSEFKTFFTSLPQPGGPGTLKTVLPKVDQSRKNRLHAKSGSLANVRCYAGYVRRASGELIHFAILVNNFSARTAQMQVGIEGFMNELLNY